MMRFAESACVTVDFDIVGWIPKDHIRWLAAQKHLIALWLPSVPADCFVLFGDIYRRARLARLVND
jgi:hypothetical protein